MRKRAQDHHVRCLQQGPSRHLGREYGSAWEGEERLHASIHDPFCPCCLQALIEMARLNVRITGFCLAHPGCRELPALGVAALPGALLCTARLAFGARTRCSERYGACCNIPNEGKTFCRRTMHLSQDRLGYHAVLSATCHCRPVRHAMSHSPATLGWMQRFFRDDRPRARILGPSMPGPCRYLHHTYGSDHLQVHDYSCKHANIIA